MMVNIRWTVLGCILWGAAGAVAAGVEPTYTAADFVQVRKIDAHVHANTDDHLFLDAAAKNGFEILSINVDYPDFPPLELQAQIAHKLMAADPQRFHFVTTFSMKGFGGPEWTANTIRHIDAERARGAVGVKVWKNIGMVERDANGRLIMLDDPRFDGVMRHLEAKGIPLIAHQAEPKNCWLPLEAMTTENDRSYFRDHPEYHMYLHPEQPSYESLIAARDRFVARHPNLNFIGAHMASLEWSVEELAKFLDAYPNATADLAARMTQVQYQSASDPGKVRRLLHQVPGPASLRYRSHRGSSGPQGTRAKPTDECGAIRRGSRSLLAIRLDLPRHLRSSADRCDQDRGQGIGAARSR